MSQEWIVGQGDDGQRLDRWLSHQARLPYGLIQKLLRKGAIRVDGKRAEGEDRLKTGQSVHLRAQVQTQMPKPPKASAEDAQKLKAMILYEDAKIIAINKPAGLAVQGGSGQSRHLDGMLDSLAKKGERPRLVHRLDCDTSGVLLLARSREAAAALAEAFAGKEIEKIYWAVTIGAPQPRQGRIDLKLAKAGALEKMRVDEEGRRAVTRYRVLEQAGKALAWVELEPITGRTHQLRAHLAAIGHPIAGDGKYGGKEAFPAGGIVIRQLHLHARRICYQGRIIEAPLPAHMQATFDALGFGK